MNEAERNYQRIREEHYRFITEIEERWEKADGLFEQHGPAFLALLNSVSHRRMQQIMQQYR